MKSHGQEFCALIDSGAAVSLLSPDIFKQIKAISDLKPLDSLVQIKAVNGGDVEITDSYSLVIEIETEKFEHVFFVTKFNLSSSYKAILGFDFLKNNETSVDFKRNCLIVNEIMVPMIDLGVGCSRLPEQEITLKLKKKTLLGPGETAVVQVGIPVLPHSSVIARVISSHKLSEKGVELVSPKVTVDAGTAEAHVEIANNSTEPVMLNKDMRICSVNNFEEFPYEIPITSHIPSDLAEKDFCLSGLDLTLKNRVAELLLKHKNAFARSTIELTAANTQPHEIQLEHNNPIKCPVYKIPYNLREEFRKQISDLEKAGIVSKSRSHYNSPALFVKQGSKWRLVLDFRRLNSVTVTQEFIIPTLDDILYELSGSNYFSALDMKSAFNQIPLHPRDRHKTAFSSPDGDKYEFNRLCFGLKNSPKAFQSIAQEVLGDLLHKGALVYIDDVILHTNTIEEHFTLLGRVLTRFEKFNLKFNPQKCQFLTKTCKFLGFIITPGGVSIDQDKTVSVNQFPVPVDQKGVRSFLGCCGFYRRYIKNFARRALPLTSLLKKNTPFVWGAEAQSAFEDLKKAILNPPILALPDPSAEIQVTTDASSQGIGAVLELCYSPSDVRPIYFFSKKLNPTQSKYSATMLEFFAIYCALNFFRAFLIGRKFKVYSDHKPLEGFLSNKNPSSKVLRWKLALEEFNYEICYVKGALNSVADHLSRYINSVSIVFPTTAELIKMQNEDSKLKVIIDGLKESSSDPRLSNYLIDEKGVLIHMAKRHSRSPRRDVRVQVCVPHCLKGKVLESVHSEIGGHLRFFKTYNRLGENFFWPDMYKDTKNFVQSCTICLERRSAFKTGTAPNEPVDQSMVPGERCHMDIFGPLKVTQAGNRYVLSMIDAFSKYIHLVPLDDIKSQTVSKAFFENYIVHRGCPRTLITDNASYFKSAEFSEFCRLHGIEKRHISAYSAHVNGRVEKPNQSIANILAAACSGAEDWDIQLPHTMLALNSAIHEATHASPFFLEHGRDIRLPYNLGGKIQGQIESDYVKKMMQSLDGVFENVVENLREQEEKNIKRSEINKHEGQFDYSVGALCFVRNPNLKSMASNKLRSKYEGPFRVLERFSKVNYKLRHVENARKTLNVHVNRMIPYTQRFSYLHLTEKNLDEMIVQEPRHKYNLRARANSS